MWTQGDLCTGLLQDNRSQIWGWVIKWCLFRSRAVKRVPGKPVPVCFLFRDPFSPLTHTSELFRSPHVSCFSQFPTTASDQNIWLQKRSSLCAIRDFPRVVPF